MALINGKWTVDDPDDLTYDEMSNIAEYGGFPVRFPNWKWGGEYEEIKAQPKTPTIVNYGPEPKTSNRSRQSIGDNMRFNQDVLAKLLNDAFTAGQDGSYELKDQVIDEMIWAYQKGQIYPLDVVPFKELCSLPSGRKIFHPTLGEGVMTIKNNERFVQFAGFQMNLAEDGWPWTEKLQVIS